MVSCQYSCSKVKEQGQEPHHLLFTWFLIPLFSVHYSHFQLGLFFPRKPLFYLLQQMKQHSCNTEGKSIGQLYRQVKEIQESVYKTDFQPIVIISASRCYPSLLQAAQIKTLQRRSTLLSSVWERELGAGLPPPPGQDPSTLGRGWGKGRKKNTTKFLPFLKVGFPWFAICVVAISLWLTQAPMKIHQAISGCVWCFCGHELGVS